MATVYEIWYNNMYHYSNYNTLEEAKTRVVQLGNEFPSGQYYWEILEVPHDSAMQAYHTGLDNGSLYYPLWFTSIMGYDYSQRKLGHLSHIDLEHPDFISFYPNAEKRERGLRTRQKPGKYLKTFYSDKLTDVEIEYWAAKHKETYSSSGDKLYWAETPEEISLVYQREAEFGSCMQYAYNVERKSWGSGGWPSSMKNHPTAAYGAGDLSVAYLLRGETLKARALVWREKGLVGRVYGDGVALRRALAKEGIKTTSTSGSYDSMAGAKLLRLPVKEPDKTRTVGRHEIPYIEGGAPTLVSHPYLDGDLGFLVESADKQYLTIEGANVASQIGRPYIDGRSAQGVTNIAGNCAKCGSGDRVNKVSLIKQEDDTFKVGYCCHVCSRTMHYLNEDVYSPPEYVQDARYYDDYYGWRTHKVVVGVSDCFISEVDGLLYADGSIRVRTTKDGLKYPIRMQSSHTFVSEVDGHRYSILNRVVVDGRVMTKLQQDDLAFAITIPETNDLLFARKVVSNVE